MRRHMATFLMCADRVEFALPDRCPLPMVPELSPAPAAIWSAGSGSKVFRFCTAVFLIGIWLCVPAHGLVGYLFSPMQKYLCWEGFGQVGARYFGNDFGIDGHALARCRDVLAHADIINEPGGELSLRSLKEETPQSLDKELVKDDDYLLDYCGHETRGKR